MLVLVFKLYDKAYYWFWVKRSRLAYWYCLWVLTWAARPGGGWLGWTWPEYAGYVLATLPRTMFAPFTDEEQEPAPLDMYLQ